MANLWQDWSWPHASWFFVFINFQVTAFAFVSVKGPWKEGESERTLRRRKGLFTSNWSGVGGCKWEICNLVLSRCHNQIPSLCGADVFRSQLALRWSFYTTENACIVSAKEKLFQVIVTCDLEHQQSNIKINKTGIQFEIFCKHLVFP